MFHLALNSHVKSIWGKMNYPSDVSLFAGDVNINYGQ